jgi:hypothetical protein
VASISAELHVEGHTYPGRQCTYSFTQATGDRGRVLAKVRPGRVELLLDVPHDEVLLNWASTPHKPLAGHVVFLNAQGGVPHESVAWEAGQCVGYREEFEMGSIATGSYVCFVTIVAPKLTLQAGLPTPYVPPAPGEHGLPPVASAQAAAASLPDGTVSTCPPDVTARLQLQVKLACKSFKSRCSEEDLCPTLLEKVVLFKACQAARDTIMNQCFDGGDDGHRNESKQRANGIKRCERIYQSKCVPRTKRVPVLRPIPSDVPDPHKTDQKAPAMIGTALILYYILQSLELAL